MSKKTITVECLNCKAPIEVNPDQLAVTDTQIDYIHADPWYVLVPVRCAKCDYNMYLPPDVTNQIMKERIIETRIETEKEMSKKIVVELTARQAREIEEHILSDHWGATECDTSIHLLETIQKQTKPEWEITTEKARLKVIGSYCSHLYALVYATTLWEPNAGTYSKTVVIIERWPVFKEKGFIGKFDEINFYQGEGAGVVTQASITLPNKGCGPLLACIDDYHFNVLSGGLEAFLSHLEKESNDE